MIFSIAKGAKVSFPAEGGKEVVDRLCAAHPRETVRLGETSVRILREVTWVFSDPAVRRSVLSPE